MIKRFHKRQQDTQQLFYRVNERIFAHQLRVLDNEGKQIGVFSKFEALQKAREVGFDLVEIAPNAKPPVAKIVDYKKFLYQQNKKRQEEKKKAKVTETKEVRVGPFMGENDLLTLIKRAETFLQDSNKVRLVLKFKGRQITHPELGFTMIKKVTKALKHVSRIEREAKLEGKQIIAILSPGKTEEERIEHETKEKSQKISSQTV
ncbi:MAG TPA: translation initiation factor IF-3 [Patescibacteria group bacterium]|nr:translation initiation factor IF-3 [Patescibacteria group bacterium]